MSSEKNKCDEADTQWEDRRKKDSVDNDGSYSFAPTSLSFVDACSTRTFTSGFLLARCSQMCFLRFTEVSPYARKNRPLRAGDVETPQVYSQQLCDNLNLTSLLKSISPHMAAFLEQIWQLLFLWVVVLLLRNSAIT